MLSIGVDEVYGKWRACVLEDGQVVELQAFADSVSVLAYLAQTCATYPESVMMSALDEVQRNQESCERFLIAIESLNRHTYCLLAVQTLPSIPAHRQNLGRVGSGHMLANAAALLYRLRQREATWDEMQFLLLEAGEWGFSVVVIEQGKVVNYLTMIPPQTEQAADHQLPEQTASIREEAFWEQLTQGLAGLLAVHHLEDIVILGERKDEVIARFEGMYAFYHFPHDEQEGYEAAMGAAWLAANLSTFADADAVIERLQIPLAHDSIFS